MLKIAKNFLKTVLYADRSGSLDGLLVSNFPTGDRLPESIVRDEESIILLFFNGIDASQGVRESVSNFLTPRGWPCKNFDSGTAI
jgi:hypothetical protein